MGIYINHIWSDIMAERNVKKTLNFLWSKRLTFCLICPRCNTLSGCYSIDELFINQKNGEECGNCGAEIPIVEANIQYAIK